MSLGPIMDVIKALLSFANASALYPSELSEICPKLELELVIEASPPDSRSKCLLNPIAKTDTIWIKASFVTLMWLVSHPLR